MRSLYIHKLHIALGAVLAGVSFAVSAALPIHTWTTGNGAKVFFAETHAIPVLDVRVDFDAGARRDPPGKSGLAALTAGSVDKGIQTDAGEISEAEILDTFADAGAIKGTGAGMDRAGFTLRFLPGQKASAGAVKLFAQMISRPSFPEKLLERDKVRVIAALREEATRPESIASKAFMREIYPLHPYGENAIPETVQSITRDEVAAFHRAHYTAGNAVITIVGDADREKAEKLAEDISRGLPASGEKLPDMPSVGKITGKTETIPHPASQSHVFVGAPAMKRGDPDFFALSAGNYVLGGGGFSSRLMEEVREKRGFVYSIYSTFRPMKQEGPFLISLQTEKKQTGEALKVARAILKDLLEKGPSKEELAAAKSHMVNGFVMQMDSNRKMLELVSMIGCYNLPLDYLDTWTANAEKVTAEDVKKAMSEKIDAENLVTVIVGGAE